MKKICCQILGLILTIAMLTSFIPTIPVSAALAVNQIRNIDFSNAVTDDIATFNGGWDAMEFPKQSTAGAGELHVAAEGGVFGKDESDMVMHMYHNPDVAYTVADPYTFLNFGSGTNTVLGLSQGQWQKLSFEIAYDGGAGTKYIDAMYNGSWLTTNWGTGYSGKNSISLFKMTSDGRIAIFNEVLQSDSFTHMEKGRWYDIDLLFYSGDSTATDDSAKNYYTLYVNNEAVATRTFVPTTAKNGSLTTFQGFAGFWLGQYVYEIGATNADNKYPQKDLYIDNFCLMTLQADSKPYVYQEWIKNDMDYTSSTVPANGSFYGATIDSTRTNTAYTYETGIGGKADDEYSFVMKTTDINSSNTAAQNIPYLYFFRTGNDVANGKLNHNIWQDSINWEASILLKDFNNLDGSRFEVATYYQNTSDSTSSFITMIIRPDGNIEANGVGIAGTYKQNEWLRVGISMNQTAKKVSYYLNGRYVGSKTISDMKNIDRFKWQTVLPATTASENGTVAIDNLVVYSGDYIVPSTLNKVKADVKDDYADKVSANHSTNTLSLCGLTTAGGVTNALSLPAGQTISYYTDDTYQTKAENLESGMKAVLTDGTIYRYYTINVVDVGGYIFNGFDVKMNGVESNGKFTTGTLTATADLTMYEDKDIKAVIAQYKGKKMINVACSDGVVLDGAINPFDGTKATVTATLNITEDTDTTVKAFLWETPSLKPVCDSIPLTPAPKGEITSVIQRYPNYANKSVTFSFDDGRPEDATLIEMFDEYGVSGTFNLNSNLQLLDEESDEQKAYVKELYKNQEVANHVRNHPHLGDPSKPAAIAVSTADEYIALIEQGRSELQTITGQSVNGLVYPYTNPTLMTNSSAEEAAKIDAYVKGNSDILYSRLSSTNASFDVPSTFKDWEFTAHYLAVPSLSESFLAIPDSSEQLKLFSIWGHTYEFANNGNNWNVIEDLLKEVTARNIWVPTNVEYVKYVNALKALTQTTNSITNNSDVDVYLLVNYKPVKIEAGTTYNLYEQDESNYPQIYLAGDSTCEITDLSIRPRTGWGMKLSDYFDENIVINNHAVASRSTKTFISEGRLDTIKQSIKKGDYLFIQFGHNDSMTTRPEKYCTVDEYKANLKTFINAAKEVQATPVLITSIRLCIFENDVIKADDIDAYRNAMIEVAKEMDVAYIDAASTQKAYLETIGKEEAKKLYMVSGYAENYTGTTDDTTHLSEAGASKVAEIIATAVKNSNSLGELAVYVK